MQTANLTPSTSMTTPPRNAVALKWFTMPCFFIETAIVSLSSFEIVSYTFLAHSATVAASAPLAGGDERLQARAHDFSLGSVHVHEHRGRTVLRVERRSVERQVLLEYHISLNHAIVVAELSARVQVFLDVLEPQLLERDRWVGHLQPLHHILFSVERRVSLFCCCLFPFSSLPSSEVGVPTSHLS